MREQPLFEHPVQTIAAVSAVTGISRTTILKACKSGPLKECSYASGETWLIDTGLPQFAVWLAAHSQQRRVKGQMTKQAIHDAVWEHKIDQMNTHEVAERFGCPVSTARKILLAIVNGTSGDERFALSPEGEGFGVIIEDGRIFNYSPMDMNEGAISTKAPKHYIWFCS